MFQNVFLRVNERLGSLRSDDAIRSWVGQLTRNCCLDVIRASGRVVPVEEVEEQVADDASAKLDEALARVLEGLLIASMGVGGLLAPVLIHYTGIRWALVITGLLLPVFALAATTTLRSIGRRTAPPVHLELVRQLLRDRRRRGRGGR